MPKKVDELRRLLIAACEIIEGFSNEDASKLEEWWIAYKASKAAKDNKVKSGREKLKW